VTAPVTRRWFRVGDHALHARTTGRWVSDVPGAVLVHGIGVSSRYMEPLARELGPTLRTAAVDLPGFGRSSKPPRTLGVQEHADVLARFVQVAGLAPAVLIGNSFGCQVVAACAASQPALVRATVLLGPTIDPSARSAARQVWSWVRDVPRERAAQLPLAVRDFREAGTQRIAATLRLALEDRVEETLPGVSARTLVVRGGRDPIVRQAWAEEAARLLPQGRLAVLPGVAHAVNFAAPEELAQVVLAFLAEPGTARYTASGAWSLSQSGISSPGIGRASWKPCT
jgi:2-hydroxy-6-oxonona-2,4-dienedioate hydrolase